MVKRLLAATVALSLSGPLVPHLSGQGPGGGAFQTRFPDAHRLLTTLEAIENVLLQELVTDLQNDPTRLAHERAVRERARGMEHSLHLLGPMEPPIGALERQSFQELTIRIEGRSTVGAGIAIPTEAGRRLDQTLARSHELRRALLDVFADDRIADQDRAAEAAVATYLARAEASVLARPISMETLFTHDQATTFQGGYSLLRGLLYTARWFEMAVFEPLIVFATPAEQEAGVQAVIDRFFAKLQNPPEAMPTELPMAPTIAPSLIVRSRRAAAALDNANLLWQAAADALLSPLVTDKSGAIDRAIATYTDPAKATNDYDWILMANRHGIFNQGGPAIGSLGQSERNREAHTIHRGMVLPGMPGG